MPDIRVLRNRRREKEEKDEVRDRDEEHRRRIGMKGIVGETKAGEQGKKSFKLTYRTGESSEIAAL